MRRRAGLPAAAAAAAAGLLAAVAAAVLIAGCGTDARQAANNSAAERDAARIAEAEQLPAAAVRVGSGSGHSFEATTDGRTAEVRWRVPGESPSQVYAYVDGTRRPGMNSRMRGSEPPCRRTSTRW